MSVARISGPQLLYPPLRPPQATVEQESVSVGGDLRGDPAGQTHRTQAAPSKPADCPAMPRVQYPEQGQIDDSASSGSPSSSAATSHHVKASEAPKSFFSRADRKRKVGASLPR